MKQPPGGPLIRYFEDWRAIVTLNVYRSLIGFGLVALLLFGAANRLFDVTLPALFRLASLVYLAQCALALAAALSRWPTLRFQVLAASMIDVVFFTCLTLAGSGVKGGLGMLLLTPIAAAGILLPPRNAALVAACAALGMIGQETWRTIQYPSTGGEFVQTGILGSLFFLVAALSHWLARRAQVSEALAAERASEVRDLAAVNRHIIQQMQVGVLVLDAGERIRLSNDAAEALLELDTTRPVADRPLSTIAPALVSALDEWRRCPHATGTSLRVGNQTLLPVFSRLGRGDDAAVVIFLEDAMRQREQAQQLKLVSVGRLTANIAHEIRNPLGAISHAGQLLAESEHVSDDDRRLLDIVHRHARRIDAIVDSVMGLSRRSRTARQRLALHDWLGQAIHDYRETRDHAPRFTISAIESEIQVDFDPDHLRRVLFNLWANAQRYASPQDRELTILLSGRHDRSRRFCLDVIDNGPGIHAEILDDVMEPFYTTGREGTGLGLHIAGELCEANGARLLPVAHTGGACFRIVFARVSPATLLRGNQAPIETAQ